MKVLNIIQCANLGGMEQASLRLMKAMQPLGIQSQLLSLHPVGGLGPLLDDAGIRHSGMSYWGPAGIGLVPPLTAKLRKSQANQFVMTGPHLAAMAAMKLAGVAGAYLAVHFHHTGVKSPTAWRAIYRLALDRFRWVTFPSDFVREEAMALYPPLRDRSLTIRYPQELPPPISGDDRSQARAKLGFSDLEFVVGNAGWLIRRKRFDVFLRVAQKVAVQMPGARFVIAGGGEEESSLKQLAEDLGISGKVVWLGWQEDLGDFYNSLDALLFNADWDALPVTPQEAVARGIPLVASVLNSGIREVFDSSLASRVLPTHHEDDLAEQLLFVARSPKDAGAQANASREHFLKICEPSLIAAQHMQLLLD
jgi:glycosyltransferase involved in cell wall biosynthesis